MKKNLLNVFVMAFFCASPFLFSSCPPDPDYDYDPVDKTVHNITGGGYVIATNTTTKESVKAYSGIDLTGEKKLSVKNGETIDIKFVPDDEYSKYTFSVTYSLEGNELYKSEGKYEYEYPVSGLAAGTYIFRFTNKFESNNGNEYTKITGGGRFDIVVEE